MQALAKELTAGVKRRADEREKSPNGAMKSTGVRIAPGYGAIVRRDLWTAPGDVVTVGVRGPCTCAIAVDVLANGLSGQASLEVAAGVPGIVACDAAPVRPNGDADPAPIESRPSHGE